MQRDLHEEFSEGDDPSDWYDRTEEALTRAIKFLRSEGVPHISLMPYTFPIPVLAVFFTYTLSLRLGYCGCSHVGSGVVG